MMAPASRTLSINLKLPLLVIGLLLVCVTVFATIGYRQVSAAASADAQGRLSKVVNQLAPMIGAQHAAMKVALGTAAGDSALVALLGDSSSAAVTRANLVLAPRVRDTANHVTAEVRDRAGNLLASAPGTLAILAEAAAAAPPRPDSASISTLYVFRDSVFFELTAPLPGNRGWLIERRVLSYSAENVKKLSDLFGTSATLLLGNREGEPIWTDYISRTEPPQLGDSTEAYQRGGSRRMGVFAAATGTPFILGAEFPRDVVMAGPHAMMRRFIYLALLIIAVGAAAGWLMSRHISQPLGRLTHAAEDVASGRARYLPASARGDEIGRLGEAFRIMLERVREGQVRLEEQLAELGRAKERVRGTLETMRAVFQASPLPIVALDCDEHVEFWNLAAERVFGWPADEVIGKPLPFVPEDLRDESDRLWADALGGQVFTGLEVRRRRRDGTLMDMRLTVSAILGPDEKTTGVVAVYEDITERRRLEDHMRHIQRLDAIGKLAGGVAHDFNNLLTVILTEAELGIADPGTDGGHAALTAVQQTAERAATLTRQLLAFARRQPLKPEVFDLTDMVSDLDKMLQRLIGDNVTLEANLPAGLWPVKADRGQIEQVITNLVVNARDAMPNGGRVTITAKNLTLNPADTEGMPELEAGDWTTFSIADNGTGMTDDVRTRLFEPFFTTKEAGKGTGLGLATCHGIVQQSGGRILVLSEVGKGSVFTVQLPRALSLDGSVDQAAETPDDSDTGGIILLVEDYSELRSVAARVLNRAGFQVVAAAHGEEALRLIDAGLRPDLLVSDIGLPGINGVRLAEQVRMIHPHVRVLLCSGSKDYEHLLRNIDESEFLEKPYRVEELVRGVRAIFKKPIAKAS